ncbi:Glucose/arabinose dehydrogenase, beta-propeller fold [Halopseudomonas xinjiangensis]|uniref:Glucose/arabinose dehydrogenase, beta-propeller fold n=1 Tax=Halopseudomonas xinjiangensis TaxID=487184 RepID=A0A1H1L6C5_9GAMM|nr:PQQ-dependent sugar dehydrogenase [Halopseudomonas xinjiangensis]SDR69469.1 Glucose/arabinose dehydrogenase, beta-propeller fold [Halopseudomonas xinjiangensis]
MSAKRNALLVAVGLGLSLGIHAAGYQTEVVAEGLDHPWSLAFLPDGRMLVTERAGRLRVIDEAGNLREEPVDGLPDIFNQSQAGLFEVALDPQYDETGRLFISYACGTESANHTCLISARLQDNRLTEVTEIFRVKPAKEGGAHYGGRIAFLPDNTLVLGLGDGFTYREQAQNKENHLGSIVRLKRDGSAPQDNPFVDEPGAQPEIFSIGNRNVQGIVYDQANQRIVAHEHGPRGGDEINIIEPGKNYGWPKVTHGVDYSGAVISPHEQMEGMEDPIVMWKPSIAPSGMTLYRGGMFPEWDGDFLVSALAAREVRRVRLDGREEVEQESLFKELGERFRDVRTGPDGAIFLLTDAEEGQVIRVYRE